MDYAITMVREILSSVSGIKSAATYWANALFARRDGRIESIHLKILRRVAEKSC